MMAASAKVSQELQSPFLTQLEGQNYIQGPFDKNVRNSQISQNIANSSESGGGQMLRNSMHET